MRPCVRYEGKIVCLTARASDSRLAKAASIIFRSNLRADPFTGLATRGSEVDLNGLVIVDVGCAEASEADEDAPTVRAMLWSWRAAHRWPSLSNAGLMCFNVVVCPLTQRSSPAWPSD